MTVEDMVAQSGLSWEDGFLSEAECRFVLEELEFALWRDNQVVGRSVTGDLNTFASERRTSTGTNDRWFTPKLAKKIAGIEARIAARFGVAPDYLEHWQAMKYRGGERFELHHDSGVFGSEPAGERVMTFLIYLKEPREGGETYFPELDFLAPPRAGRLISWNNLLPDGSPNNTFRHSATPVRRGTKVILTTWSRERPIRG